MIDKSKLAKEELFFWFVKERENVRISKEAGESKPWTTDKILQSYRFCNIRRMDDKVSKWLMYNWWKPYKHSKYIIPAIALGRFLNKIETLNVIGFPKKWDPNGLKKLLRKMRDNGVAVFNGAYIVRGNDGEDKIASVVDYYVQPLIDDPLDVDTSSMFNTWSALKERHGYGSFMSGQVVADMRWALDGTWEDKMTWAPYGPGSMRGMNRLHERPVDYVCSGMFLEELRGLIGKCLKKLPIGITKRLEAHDYQNCLCEFDKYCRAFYKEGTPKQLYPGV